MGALCWMLAPMVLAETKIEVSDPWIRLMPAVSSNTAAYFTVKNVSGQKLILKRVSTEIVKTVEMHTIVEKEGLMSMQPLSKVELPDQGAVKFKPGGKHLMLLGLKKPLMENDVKALTLHFSDGTSKEVAFKVMSESSESEPDSHQHDHQH